MVTFFEDNIFRNRIYVSDDSSVSLVIVRKVEVYYIEVYFKFISGFVLRIISDGAWGIGGIGCGVGNNLVLGIKAPGNRIYVGCMQVMGLTCYTISLVFIFKSIFKFNHHLLHSYKIVFFNKLVYYWVSVMQYFNIYSFTSVHFPP